VDSVRPKKHLGQHFLADRGIARRIAGSLKAENCDSVLEIGPGKGILTGFLMERGFADFRVVEIDREAVAYLKNCMGSKLKIIEADFLKLDIPALFPGTVAVTGNFPYNISSQILFRVLQYRDRVPELTGMFQREVAQRVCAGPGSKIYGILSVLVQAYYKTENLFTVSEKVFFPPPKVKSSVIRLIRIPDRNKGCDEELFFKVVKTCFNQRRKTIKNSIRAAFSIPEDDFHLLGMRPEQLSVEQFAELTEWVSVSCCQKE